MIICCANCRSPIEEDDAASCPICERDGLCDECALACCLADDDDDDRPFSTLSDFYDDENP